jgi:hypothetical protein
MIGKLEEFFQRYINAIPKTFSGGKEWRARKKALKILSKEL